MREKETHMPDYFVNRNKEILLFSQLLSGNLVERILYFQDDSGRGKSFLLREFQKMARVQGYFTVFIEFGQSIIDYLDFCRDFIQCLPSWDYSNFEKTDRDYNNLQTHFQIGGGDNTTSSIDQGDRVTYKETSLDGIAGRDNINIGVINISERVNDALLAERRRKIKFEISKAFINDCIKNKDGKVVVFLDACEKCDLETIAWIEKWLFSAIQSQQLTNVICVLAGRRRTLFLESKHLWSNILITVDELTSFDYESVELYFNSKRNLPLPKEHIQAYYQLVRDDPLLMGQIADRLMEK